jgi:urease accessory protein
MEVIGTTVKQFKAIDINAQSELPRLRGGPREMASLVPVRSRGEIRLGFCDSKGRTALAEGYQAGCLRFRLPRVERDAGPCAILLNTGGGLTGGDRLSQQVDWGEGTAATITSQAAEKIYRSLGPDVRIDTRLVARARARAEWLPQETILFDNARLIRDIQIRLAPDADFLGLEAVVLGRAAMGETMNVGALEDRLRIWRGEGIVYADAFNLHGEVDLKMRRQAVGAGSRAMAVIIMVSVHAASLLTGLRDALAGAVGQAAASCWNGMLVTRFLARDGTILRHDILRALQVLRRGQAMPRVWSC